MLVVSQADARLRAGTAGGVHHLDERGCCRDLPVEVFLPLLLLDLQGKAGAEDPLGRSRDRATSTQATTSWPATGCGVRDGATGLAWQAPHKVAQPPARQREAPSMEHGHQPGTGQAGKDWLSRRSSCPRDRPSRTCPHASAWAHTLQPCHTTHACCTCTTHRTLHSGKPPGVLYTHCTCAWDTCTTHTHLHTQAEVHPTWHM